MRLGDFIRLKRKERGLSLSELSMKSGISHPYLSQLESGLKQAPSHKTIEALSKALEIDEDQLAALVEQEARKGRRIVQLRDLLERSSKRLEDLMILTDKLERLVSRLEQMEAHYMAEGSHDLVTDPGNLLVADIVKEVRSINRIAERLSRQLPSTLRALERRLQFPRYPQEAEELMLKAESLGYEGISWASRLIDMAGELLGVRPHTTKEVGRDVDGKGDPKHGVGATPST